MKHLIQVSISFKIQLKNMSEFTVYINYFYAGVFLDKQ